MLTASCGLANAAAAPITTRSLLEEMTDLPGMAEFPNPAYTCKLFSSYDRRSKSPNEEGWFANDDRGNAAIQGIDSFIRVEEKPDRKEYVMMDAAGPGAVVRIWSANPEGTLRIYLDGAEKPVLEAPMNEVLGSKFHGLPKPISGELAKGWNLYFPIPYANHCKITSDKNFFYYHVNYRTYMPGAVVKSFQLKQLDTLAAEIKKAAAQLVPQRDDFALGGSTEKFEVHIPAGGTVRRTFSGSKAFTQALIRLSAKDMEKTLRGTILKINFDGEECVASPLGDFFASAPGVNPYTSLPLGVSKGGEMFCHWTMPFKKTAAVELINFTDQDVDVTGELGLKDYKWTENTMHFHAKWRIQTGVPTRPFIDWNFMTAKGKGVYAGAGYFIDNPVTSWWGEGDEKIYVDGETFPSHFGTGTEDYFGFAWCSPELFSHAYHAQTRCDGPGNYGRTSVNRFHILDRIPFTTNFKFDIEVWHWDATCKMDLAVTTFWYAQPGAADGFKPIRAEEAIVPPMAPYNPPPKK
jgi:hypothetical protein